MGQSAIAGVQWRIALPEKDLALKKSGGRNLTADLNEKTIQLWFDMWLKQKDLGIDNIFTENAVYTESWGPEYHTRQLIKHWFQEWNTRGKVVTWEIKQFFHKENQTMAEWYFKNEMQDGSVEEFDGCSLVEWAENGQIKSLKEFGCNLHRYNPYQKGNVPQFQDGAAKWF